MGLTHNDNAVLGALFDPEASLGRPAYPEALSASNDNTVPGNIQRIEQDAVAILNIAEPDIQDVYSSLKALTSVIEDHPNYASAYANRAQARRLLPDALEKTSDIANIFSDLHSAISLADPPSSTTALTSDSLRVLSSAHSHRGYLLMHASANTKFRERLLSLNLPLLHHVTEVSQFEDLASKDFSIAGRYGNKTAQQLAVKTNPYAKLCGQIVKEALQREIKEYYEGGQMVY